MLPGTSNLSKAAIIEQLIYIAGEAGNAANMVARSFQKTDLLPHSEVVDKILRQDIFIAKENVEKTVDKVLEYLASARMELVDHKEFFINIALRYKKIVEGLEKAAHRLLLLTRKLPESAQDLTVNKYVKELVQTQERMLFRLSSSIRSLLSVNHGTREMLRSIESDFDRLKLMKASADEAYRELFELLLDRMEGSPLAFILYRELMDSLYNNITLSLEQGRDILVLARSLSQY